MRQAELEQYAEDELDVLIEATREDLATADENQNAVAGHDLRCALDQMVAAREKLNAQT